MLYPLFLQLSSYSKRVEFACRSMNSLLYIHSYCISLPYYVFQYSVGIGWSTKCHGHQMGLLNWAQVLQSNLQQRSLGFNHCSRLDLFASCWSLSTISLIFLCFLQYSLLPINGGSFVILSHTTFSYLVDSYPKAIIGLFFARRYF